MSRRPGFHLAWFLVLALASAAPAQVPKAAAPAPAAKAAPRPPASPAQPAWSACEGLAPRPSPSTDAEPAGPVSLGFLEPCLVLEEKPPKADDPSPITWLRIARRDAPTAAVGWVDSREVLRTSSAEIDPAANMPMPAVIVNTAASLQQEGAEEYLEVPLRNGPRADASRGASARIADLAFPYARAHGFVLVGPEPRFDPAGKTVPIASAVLGWVAEDFLMPMPSRRAVRWDSASTLPDAQPRRTTAGRIFRGPRDAYEPPKNAPPPAIHEEQWDANGLGIDFGPSLTRMPLLPHDDEGPDFPEFDPDTNNQLLRVAGIGALLAEGDTPATRDEAAQVEAELARVRKRLDAARQVLFVIDDTESMGPQFPRVARTVRRIIDDASREPRQTIQVGVAYYNDVQGGRPPGYQTMRLVDARSPAGKALLNEVATHGQRLQNGGDFPEMVIDGLTHALDDARFEAQPNASRLVILIGDHGNRGVPDYPAVLKKFQRADAALIHFVAVQVVDPEKPQSYADPRAAELARDAARDFRDQMTALVNALNQAPEAGGSARASFIPLANEDMGLTALLDKEYDAMKRREQDLRQTIARIQARNYPTRLGLEMRQLLERRGVPVEQIQKLTGVKIGQEGYAWRWSRPPLGDDPGIPQVRIEAILSRPEATRLIATVGRVLNATDSLAAIRKEVGGDASKTYEQAVLRPQGVFGDSLIWKRPADSLTQELLAGETPPARQRLERLEALVKQPPGGASRWFRLPGGTTEWCWIDTDGELP